jgi:outer membrane protein assembly factor BamB
MGHLFCLNATDGSVIWKKDLATEYGTEVPVWGMAGAPLVEENLLVVNAGGRPMACLIAFDKYSGREIWRALPDRPGYSSPIVIDAGGARQIIFWSAEAVNSLDPKTGKLYWRIPHQCASDQCIATPVHYRDLLFVSSYSKGAMMLKLDTDRPGAGILWKEPRDLELDNAILHCLISTPYFRDDYFYAIDKQGELRCLEIATGKRIWETLEATGKERWANAHLTPNGDRTFLFNDQGELILAELKPRGYHEISRTRLLQSKHGVQGLPPWTWAHPAYANRHVFLRNNEELISVSLVESK